MYKNISCDFIMINLKLYSRGWQATSCKPNLANKIIFDHSHTHLFTIV